MCGIVGTLASKGSLNFVVDALRKLEYRGYDSAGIAYINENDVARFRFALARDSVNLLSEQIAPMEGSYTAIGHTRWATHGKPIEDNAHPHFDCQNSFALVHNGIVENHRQLERELKASGHVFQSETDTEVLVHLIEQEFNKTGSLMSAVVNCVRRIEGTYAIAVISSHEPDTIVASRYISPLIIGFDSDGANGKTAYLASDIPALLQVCDEFYSLADKSTVAISPKKIEVVDEFGKPSQLKKLEINWDLSLAERGGYESFMLKEIHEQSQAVEDTLLDRLDGNAIVLDELKIPKQKFNEIDRICIVGCGTSYHAGLTGKYIIEKFTRIPVEVDISSEFRYRSPILTPRTLFVGISQSGETVDTIQALEMANSENCLTLAITNVTDSSMARLANGVLYTRAGPEIGVAATKTFVAQLSALWVLSMFLCQVKGLMTAGQMSEKMDLIFMVPRLMSNVLESESTYRQLAQKYKGFNDYFFIGRNLGYPTALEGALKLKEISYLHAEGFAGGELKHGPIALIDDNSVVVGIGANCSNYEKLFSNLKEVEARGAHVLAIAKQDDEEMLEFAETAFVVPKCPALIAPFLNIIPLQLLAYELATLRGNDVDKPRNLAKTVTVE